jgi:hypothetical protein
MPQQIADSFSSIAAILRQENPDKVLLLAQAGLAFRRLADLYGPDISHDIDDLGMALAMLRLRLPGAIPDGNPAIPDNAGSL